MEDLQDALQSILSDPEQMARVAALAESLGLKPPENEATGNRQQATGETRDNPAGADNGRPPESPPRGETPQNCHSEQSEESVLSSLLSDKNGFYLEKAMGLLSASSGGETRVLAALRPTLGPEGQTRVDRALRAAKLSHLAGALLTQRRGTRV